jgi:hypothetical protein
VAEYVNPPLETEPSELAELAYVWLSDNVPGWQAPDGGFETILIEALAQIAAEVRDVASDVPIAVYKHFGSVLHGITQVPAAQATATSTWTLIDAAGHTIPAGTVVGIRDTAGDLVGFTVTDDVAVLAGSTVTAAGAVGLIAVEAGEASNALTGPVEVIDALDFVDTIVLVAATAGGAEAETDDEYLNRLTDELTLLTPNPILPIDFAILARRIPGVERALAVDGYNPADLTTNNERMVTVYAIDAAGLPVAGGVLADVAAYLESLREATFVVNTSNPTVTTIDVVTSVLALPDFDTATLQAWVAEAIANYLDPANWGVIGSTASRDPAQWSNVTKVYYLEMAEAINRVNGVDRIETLYIGQRRAVTAVAATDILTATAHGFVADERIVFRSLTGGAGLVVGTTYFARDITANTFKVAATVGGAAVNITSDVTVGVVVGLSTADVTLAGQAPLPALGTATVVVDAP